MQAFLPVLALCDLSPAATNAAWRAGLVARDLGVPLRLMLAQPDPRRLAQARPALEALAREIAERIGIDSDTLAVQSQLLPAIVAAAPDASLLVIGGGTAHPLRCWLFGTLAERLLRRSGLPVLVVRRTAGRGYRRVLVPVDLGPAAASVLAGASALTRGPRMEVLHALSTREELSMRVADVPESVVRGLRRRAAQRAQAVLQELIVHAGAIRAGAVAGIGFGPAASVVLARERALRAELVVIGKRPRGWLADFFLGSVTQQVLAGARGDVLALPLPAGSAGAVAGVRDAQPSLHGAANGSDFRDQLDLDAGTHGDLRHAERAARV